MPVRPLAFINYRRDDTRDWANLIADVLRRKLGPDTVFIDTDNIRTGDQWQRKINEALARCTVLLPIIGPKWLFLQNSDDGRRRLDVDNDWVRCEIEYALKESKPVIPIVVSGATMPAAGALAASIKPFLLTQSMRIDDKRDVDLLIQCLVDRLDFVCLRTELEYPRGADKSPPLSEGEVHAALERLPGWAIEQRESEQAKDRLAHELVFVFKFNSFDDALHFMTSAARYISRTDHHPFWENQYREIRVRLTTWDIGLRVSAKDVRLAEYLQWLFREYTPGERPGDLNALPENFPGKF